MNPTLAHKGLLLLAVPFLLLLAVLGLVARLEHATAEAQWWSGHSKDVVNQAQHVLANVADAQSGARGYVVTRDPAFLAPYDATAGRWEGDLDRLADLVRDNEVQAAAAAGIRAAAAAALARLAETVALARAGDAAGAAALVRGGGAERQVADLRARVAAFLEEEHRLDRDRAGDVARARGRVYGVLAGGGATAALVTGALAVFFYRGVSRRFAVVVDNTRRLAAGAALAPPLGGTDEIARLDGAFRDMAAELARTVESLRQSAREVRDLYDNAPCGYHSVDPTGTVVAMNRTELAWLGYAAEEVIGRRRFAEVVAPAGRDTYAATFARVREFGAAADVEVELVRRDGTTFPVLLNSSAIRGPDGGYLRSRTTLTDLTERRRAEAATRLFADVVRSIPIGLLIYQLDAGDPPTLRVRSGNPGAVRLLGVPIDEAAGRPVVEVFPAIPADQVRRYSAVAASGRPDDLGEFRYGDGRVAERWWAVQAFPLPDRSVGIAFQDVSARRRAEDEVRELNAGLEERVRGRTAELAAVNERLRAEAAERARAEAAARVAAARLDALIETAVDTIITIDERGTVESANAAAERMFGYPAAEVVGRNVNVLMPEPYRSGHDGYLAHYLATGERRIIGHGREVTGRRKDGSTFPIHLAVSEFRAGDRRVFTGFVRDITDRKRVEHDLRRTVGELEEANRELAHKNAENEMFVYSVSHDLRSPLVNLQGFSKELEKGCRRLGALLDDPGVPPAVRDPAAALLGGKMAAAMGFIQSAVLRLSGIIEALLRLSRAGRVEYRWEAVDVSRVVARVAGAMSGTAAARGAEVAAGDLPPAWGDPTAVEQVFANLIGNALTYLDPARPGRVEVGALPAGADGLRAYYVRDNGLGIPEAHRGKIFQVFQRAHPQVAPGEGIGLAVVARIAERHRGRAWVESEAGAGSTFYVTLPAAPGGGRPEGR